MQRTPSAILHQVHWGLDLTSCLRSPPTERDLVAAALPSEPEPGVALIRGLLAARPGHNSDTVTEGLRSEE
jgi:hypothetical protein